MTLDQWIQKYNEKTDEPFKRDTRFELFYLPNKGFCEVGLSDNKKMFIINQLCGDARYWKDKVDLLARSQQVGMCGTWCIRPEIKAYIRLFGFKIIQQERLNDGSIKYVGKHKDTGKLGWATPAYKYNDTGTQAYFITWIP